MSDDEDGVSRRRLAVGVVVVLVVAVVGAYLLGLVGAPSVVAVENRFGDVNGSTTVVETDLVVANPNPIGVQLGGTSVNYTVRMNDVRMATGDKDGLAITRGNTTLAFTTLMANEQIPPWWVSHVERGERTEVVIDARVRSSLLGRTFAVPQNRTVETDIIGQFNSTETRPVNASQPVVEDPVLYINRTSATWGDVSPDTTPVDMEMAAYNPKSVPYTVTRISYRITMNGVPVGNGTTDEPHVIEGGTTETIDVRTAIRNEKLDEWWVTHLRRDQVTELRIEFAATLDLGATTVTVPLDRLTYERTIETDIFGNKDESAGGASDGDGGTSDGSGGEGGDASTATPTASPTPTDDGGLLDTDSPTVVPTATPTETDDGIGL